MPLDIQTLHFLNGLAGRSPLLDELIVFCASYLAYIMIAAFLGFLFLSRYSRREKLEIFFVTAVSSIVTRFGVVEIIRFFYHRPRPFSMQPVHQLLTDTAWSFPSGHAAFFFAMATAVGFYNRKWGIILFVAATLVTVSRVIAGIHYPSDILAGALLGIAVAYAVRFFARKISEKHPH
ncbi:MAG: PAP2 family protein [Parcubacteria group bacterium GW2011_GWB1_57_6]|nr:MAG: PAP2 family protein [Parcubacteria group bacterium GW2011_GWA1_56_13]KKW46760.1 MAG: PAP2 family protein [Parcubacteria group bacterium GW2011_GWB1_57_6]